MLESRSRKGLPDSAAQAKETAVVFRRPTAFIQFFNRDMFDICIPSMRNVRHPFPYIHVVNGTLSCYIRSSGGRSLPFLRTMDQVSSMHTSGCLDKPVSRFAYGTEDGPSSTDAKAMIVMLEIHGSTNGGKSVLRF